MSATADSCSVIVGYWNIRGLGQPIRSILEYAGIEYKDKRYDFDNADVSDRTKAMGKWSQDKIDCPLIVGGKCEQAMEFPNLPYYVETRPDGSKLKISQSMAIMRHIGRMNDLIVEGTDDLSRLEQFEQQIEDLRFVFVGYCYDDPRVKWGYPNYAEDVKMVILSNWEDALTGKDWIMGEKLTYVDFMFWEYLDWHVLLKNDILDGLESLKSYHQRFMDLPRMKEYFGSSRYQRWPLVSTFAKVFGFHHAPQLPP